MKGINAIRVWVCEQCFFFQKEQGDCPRHHGALKRQVFVRPGLPNAVQYADEWEQAWDRVHSQFP